MRKTIFVTGASGLIGSEASLFFGKAGFDVVGIDNNMRSVFFGEEASTLWTREKVMSQLGDRYQHRDCDIRDANAIKDLFDKKQGGIAGVIHTAAQPSHDWAVKDPQIDFSVKVHNYYQQAGGEDQVFQAETGLLQSKNQQVITYTVHNEAVALYAKFALALITLWNQ